MIEEKDINETKERAERYAKEIRKYLDTKDLSPDLATCLEFTLEDLTKTDTTTEKLNETCAVYEFRYKTAVEAASEFIKPESNGYSK